MSAGMVIKPAPPVSVPNIPPQIPVIRMTDVLKRSIAFALMSKGFRLSLHGSIPLPNPGPPTTELLLHHQVSPNKNSWIKTMTADIMPPRGKDESGILITILLRRSSIFLEACNHSTLAQGVFIVKVFRPQMCLPVS